MSSETDRQRRLHGPASNFACTGCGRPAERWVDQHNGNFSAMCRSCHRKQNPGDMSAVSKARWHGKDTGMSVDMAMAYLDFVPERHRIWEARQAGKEPPWTDDPILASRKFTNVFRVLDYGSQFLVNELLYSDDPTLTDVLARCFLYRMTNRPDVWIWSKELLGRYPLAIDMNDTLAGYWCDWRDNERGQVFSGAYVIMPEPGVKGVDKTRSVIKLAERMFNNGAISDLWIKKFRNSDMPTRYEILRSFPAVGDFIAMQVLTDFGYSEYGLDQDENDFVMPGPGCRNGAREIFPEMKAEEVIKWCRNTVLGLPDCPMLEGYGLREDMTYPSLMSIQNTLCEFSKYARFMRKPLSDKSYRPAHPKDQTEPFFPPHWMA